MAASDSKRTKQRIQNYFLVKEALLGHFPEKAVYYDEIYHILLISPHDTSSHITQNSLSYIMMDMNYSILML